MRAAGLDPALGGGNAVVVCDLHDDQIVVLDCQVNYALSRTEQQLEIVSALASRHRFELLIVEYDAQQRGLGNDDRMADLAAIHGFRVVPHTTRGEKADTTFGVASMDRTFRDGKVRIPWGDVDTQVRLLPLVDQLKAWRPDVPTRKLTQDAVMAFWFVWRYWYRISRARQEPPVRPTRPTWVRPDPRLVGV